MLAREQFEKLLQNIALDLKIMSLIAARNWKFYLCIIYNFNWNLIITYQTNTILYYICLVVDYVMILVYFKHTQKIDSESNNTIKIDINLSHENMWIDGVY